MSRASPREPAPELSVVVPSVNGWSHLSECLEALDRQEGVRLQIIVPERCGETVRNHVRDSHPHAELIPVPAATPIPAMRRIAFEAANAASVAVLEDHVIVPAGWAHAMLAARAEGHRVVGGSIENGAVDRLVDRAAFLCEYGHMIRPQPPGEAEWLTGNNTVYDRILLDRHRDMLRDDRWEDHLHEAIREGGVRLESRPGIRALHKMHYRSAWEYALQRYLYSRAWAGMRAREAGVAERVAQIAKTAALPPVLFARIFRNGWSSRHWRRDLLRSIPLLLVFVCAWALGEAAGWAIGAGPSPEKVR